MAVTGKQIETGNPISLRSRLGCRRALLSLSALAASQLAAQGAMAQEQSSPVVEDNIIIVTAQKRDESIRDVPQSLVVVTGEDLTSKGVQSVEDLAGQIPGVSTYNFGGAGQTSVNVRGVTVGVDTSATVATYVDDVPFGSGSAYSGLGQIGLELGSFDVQRVELLRGPQGTLYGASALGGLLKYVLVEPDMDELNGTLQLEGYAGAQSQSYAVRGAISVPVVTDKVAIRITGVQAEDGGYVDNIARGETNIDGYDKQVGRFTIAITPTDSLKLHGTVLLQRLDRDGSSDVYYNRTTGQLVYGDLQNSQPFASPFKQKTNVYSFGGEYDFGGATLQAMVARQNFDNTYSQDASEAYPALLGGFFPMNEAGVNTILNLDKTVAEVRLASSGKARLEYLLGLYYTDEDISKVSQLVGAQDGTPLGVDLGTFTLPSTYREKAAYGNLTYHFTDRFDATVGIRVARNDQSFEQIGTGVLAGNNPGGSASETAVTYLGTMRYRFGDDNLAYVRVASGYRPGGPNLAILDPMTGLPIGGSTFKSDSLWSYEAGVKLRPASWLTADVSYFHNDWKDIQLNAVRNAIGVIANGAGAKSDGVEFAFTARPIPEWTASLSGAWIDSRLNGAASDIGGIDGENLPNSPRWTLGASTDYELFDNGSFKGSIGASWKYVGERTASFDAAAGIPQYVLPAFNTLDLRAGLEAGHWNLDLYVRNLFDERGQLSATTAYAFAGGPARVTVVRPRTFGAILSTTF